MDKCEFCGKELTPGQVGLYKKITGWAQVRLQGGNNSISMPSEPQAWAHSACIDEAKDKTKGRFVQRETLF